MEIICFLMQKLHTRLMNIHCMVQCHFSLRVVECNVSCFYVHSPQPHTWPGISSAPTPLPLPVEGGTVQDPLNNVYHILRSE